MAVLSRDGRAMAEAILRLRAVTRGGRIEMGSRARGYVFHHCPRRDPASRAVQERCRVVEGHAS